MGPASDEAFWDKIAAKYARDPIKDVAGYERSLERTRGLLGEGADVLELGCGTGTTALALAASAGAYLATDFSARMIAIAQEKAQATPVPGLRFRRATAEALAAEGHAFDVVLAFNVLHLVRDLPATLGAVRALTKPGGLFVSKTGCVGEMSPLLRLVIPPMRLVGLAPHVAILDARMLQAAIAAAGFEILACERHATRGRDARPFIVARRT